jgi:Na+/H+ antiporter NhaC
MAEQLPTPTTEAKTHAPATPPISPDEQRKRKLIRAGFIALAVVIVVGLIVLAVLGIQPQNQEYTRGVRDVMIIAMAFLSIAISVLLILLVYQLTMLTFLLRDEIKPLLESINETMNTVRGTAVFMSNNVVEPTIKVASTLSGVWRSLGTLAGIRSSVQPKQRKE